MLVDLQLLVTGYIGLAQAAASPNHEIGPQNRAAIAAAAAHFGAAGSVEILATALHVR
jgi:hypothetical protein